MGEKKSEQLKQLIEVIGLYEEAFQGIREQIQILQSQLTIVLVEAKVLLSQSSDQ